MQAQKREIPIANLFPDPQNPRLPQTEESALETYEAIIEQQGQKIVALAQHICRHGQNPTDLLAVIPAEEDNSYLVVDGNRRLTAVKLLESPAIGEAPLSKSNLSKIKQLAKRYAESPLDNLHCAILENRAEADTWIELEHRGENEGAGAVKWDGGRRSDRDFDS